MLEDMAKAAILKSCYGLRFGGGGRGCSLCFNIEGIGAPISIPHHGIPQRSSGDGLWPMISFVALEFLHGLVESKRTKDCVKKKSEGSVALGTVSGALLLCGSLWLWSIPYSKVKAVRAQVRE